MSFATNKWTVYVLFHLFFWRCDPALITIQCRREAVVQHLLILFTKGSHHHHNFCPRRKFVVHIWELGGFSPGSILCPYYKRKVVHTPMNGTEVNTRTIVKWHTVYMGTGRFFTWFHLFPCYKRKVVHTPTNGTEVKHAYEKSVKWQRNVTFLFTFTVHKLKELDGHL